ncbi:MAG TPA: COX15/CtaA family protein [Enterovirga sp.]|jgi:cytochrome c oxidase assembly protein subunit 15|nr:COX15/CtaA family protein [Enterovirga sp.]
MAIAAVESISELDNASRQHRAVKTWLYVLAALVVAMVAVGGATRLTGSGLSITEWRPVTGAIPPLSHESWVAEFQRYQASPQYRLLNEGMKLGEFQFIYWWEWSHRQLGRLIGFVFFVPLLWFWLRGVIRGRLALGLLGIGALGGLQAAIGWIMVASGLQPGMVAVAPIKLMLHLIVASLILGLLVWVAAGFGRAPERDRAPPAAARNTALVFLGLVVLQIALGALVAGSRAGLTYNTWPLMDGQFVPSRDALLAATPWYENFVDNPALVQFDHRVVGYAVVAFALWQMMQLRRAAPGTSAARRATGLAGMALAQMGLGIATLVLVVPLGLALAHQLLAMALLAMAVVHVRLCVLDIRREPVGQLRPAGSGLYAR